MPCALWTIGIIFSLSIFINAQDKEQIPSRRVNPDIIAHHVAGIVNNIISISQNKKNAEIVGDNVVSLINNALQIALKAHKRKPIFGIDDAPDTDHFNKMVDADLILAIQTNVTNLLLTQIDDELL